MSISTVTSEALQLKLRQLLPSQQGFGTDLSASDTIIPIIDLTASAEGSDVGVELQQALDSATTTVQILNATTTLVSTTGFFHVSGSVTVFTNATREVLIEIFDGTTANTVFRVTNVGTASNTTLVIPKFIVFLRAGDVLRGTSPDASTPLNVTTRQLADINGTLTQPSGFNPQ